MEDFLRSVITSDAFVVGLVGLVIAGIGWLGRELRRLWFTRMTREQRETAIILAKQVVTAIEQTADAYGLDANAKKAEAMRQLSDLLQAYGIRVSIEDISSMIEAAVWSELNQFRLPEVPAEAVEAGG